MLQKENSPEEIKMDMANFGCLLVLASHSVHQPISGVFYPQRRPCRALVSSWSL